MKKEDLEKILAKHKWYDKYVGGQFSVYYENPSSGYSHHLGTIKSAYLDKGYENTELMIELEEQYKLVPEPEATWIPEKPGIYSIRLNDKSENHWKETQDGIIEVTYPSRRILRGITHIDTGITLYTLLPKGHHKIKPLILSKGDTGLREDGSRQMDKDIMKLYLLEELEFKDGTMESLLKQTTPIIGYKKQRNDIIDISDTYKAIFSENYESNKSILYTYLSTDKGVFAVSSHHIYYPVPERLDSYEKETLEYFNPEGELKVTLKDNKILLQAKYKKGYQFHDGYNWTGRTFEFDINKEIDLRKID